MPSPVSMPSIGAGSDAKTKTSFIKPPSLPGGAKPASVAPTGMPAVPKPAAPAPSAITPPAGPKIGAPTPAAPSAQGPKPQQPQAPKPSTPPSAAPSVNKPMPTASVSGVNAPAVQTVVDRDAVATYLAVAAMLLALGTLAILVLSYTALPGA
jgi:hypothetical protein